MLKNEIQEICFKKFDEIINTLKTSKFQSICHNDFWIHNILFENGLFHKLNENYIDKSFNEIAYDIFDPNSKFDGVKIFDFEYISYGSPLIDIAFLLFTSLKNNDLIKHELDLVNFYYSCICLYGITNYTLDECVADYYMAKELQFLRIMSISGRNYFRTGKINDGTRNISLNFKYLLDLFHLSYSQKD